MALTLNPYVNLRGDARAALDFYQSVLGGEVAITSFADFPEMAPPGEEHLVMHGQLTTGEGLVLMISDVPSTETFDPPAGIQISLSGDEADRLKGVWDALSTGGTVTAPYEEPPWGGTFGMLKDRYGIEWMVMCDTAPGAAGGST